MILQKKLAWLGIGAALITALIAGILNLDNVLTVSSKMLTDQSSNGYQHIFSISLTQAQYQTILLSKKSEVKALIQAEAGQSSPKPARQLSRYEQTLYKQQTEIERQLSALDASHQKYLSFLQATIRALRAVSAVVDESQLVEAKAALKTGQSKKADRIFNAIENAQDTLVPGAAKAAFERGRNATNNIDYQRAYRHFKRAIVFSPDHPLYVEGAGTMAQIMGDYQKAIGWLEKALAHYVARDSNDRETTAAIARLHNKIGSIWVARGHHKKAIGYFNSVLVSYLKMFGEEHPKVADHRNRLGHAWQSLDEHTKAIELYQLALAGDLKTFGKDHPAVARDHNHLGHAWQALGKTKQAIHFYELALTSDLKNFGQDHPLTARDRNNLGSAWHSLDETKRAIRYYELALVGYLKHFGKGHPQSAIVRNNLARAWHFLGAYKTAITYYELALASDVQTFGDGHPHVALNRHNLGMAWHALGKTQKAIRYYESALVTFKGILGANHPYTKKTTNNLTQAIKGNLAVPQLAPEQKGQHLLRLNPNR